jgi:hypothetical protein
MQTAKSSSSNVVLYVIGALVVAFGGCTMCTVALIVSEGNRTESPPATVRTPQTADASRSSAGDDQHFLKEVAYATELIEQAEDIVRNRPGGQYAEQDVLRKLFKVGNTLNLGTNLSTSEAKQKREKLQADLDTFEKKHAAFLLRARAKAQKNADLEKKDVFVRGDADEAEGLIPEFVRSKLKDPDSYEYVSGFKTAEARGPYWRIEWTWKARNAFGATLQSTEVYCVSAGPSKAVKVCDSANR